MSYATVVAVLALVLSPVLIPLIITCVHAISDWRGSQKITGSKSPAVSPAIDRGSITAQ
jgi:hypothetical protein